MRPPTHDEYVLAKLHARCDSEAGEDASQVCRWFRGRKFKRKRAERWLTAARAESAYGGRDQKPLLFTVKTNGRIATAIVSATSAEAALRSLREERPEFAGADITIEAMA